MSNEIMVDLETMGTSPCAPVISIGAVSFTDTAINATFKRNVALRSTLDAGAVPDAGAIEFWLKQPKNVIDLWLEDSKPLIDALADFSRWFKECHGDGLWGNGATFDNVILRNAYKSVNMVPPWHYRQDMCYRTVKALFVPPEFKPKLEDAGSRVHHDSLSDAIYQAEVLIQSGVLSMAEIFKHEMQTRVQKGLA